MAARDLLGARAVIDSVATKEVRCRFIPSTEIRSMRTLILWIVALMTPVFALPPRAAQAQAKDDTPARKPDAAKPEEFEPEQQASKQGLH